MLTARSNSTAGVSSSSRSCEQLENWGFELE